MQQPHRGEKSMENVTLKIVLHLLLAQLVSSSDFFQPAEWE